MTERKELEMYELKVCYEDGLDLRYYHKTIEGLARNVQLWSNTERTATKVKILASEDIPDDSMDMFEWEDIRRKTDFTCEKTESAALTKDEFAEMMSIVGENKKPYDTGKIFHENTVFALELF